MTDATTAITALRSLAALYKSITQAVKDEAIIMEQVFAEPAEALALFVTRLFEQRVQVSIRHKVHAPPVILVRMICSAR